MEKLFENLPMLLNLGRHPTQEGHIGWADAERNEETGETYVHIRLSEDASKRLGDLAEVFDLKAIGFAGILKRRRA